jgi:hypothetical protein
MKTKFAICLLLVLSILTCRVLATPVFVENYSFEDPGEGKICGWDEVDGAYYVDSGLPAEVPGWESDGAVSDSGVETGYGPVDGDYTSYVMYGDPPVYQLTDHVIQAGQIFTMTIMARITAASSDMQMELYYYDEDSDSRVPVATEIITLIDRMEEYTLSFEAGEVPESIGKKIGMQFTNTASGWVGFDAVQLDVELSSIALVSPAVGDRDVGVDDNLYWDQIDPNITSFDVYFYESTHSEPNLLLDCRTLGTQLTAVDLDDGHFMAEPGTMATDSDGVLHYWIVDAIQFVEGPGGGGGSEIVFPGGIWYFWTKPTVPIIVTDPVSQTGEVVTLVIETIGEAPTAYDWYKVGDPEDTLYETTSVPSLTIDFSTATIDDEGYYYCVAKNDNGSSAPSAVARVMKSRLVGWWKLNDDLTDSVAEVESGAPEHNGVAVDPNGAPVDPNFIDGVYQSGLEFFADGRIVIIPETGEYFNFHPQGMTVSLWLNSETTGWDGIISKHIRPAVWEDWVGWVIDLNGADDSEGWLGATHFTIRHQADLFGNDYDGAMNDGQWYLFTAVMDPGTQTTRVYVNGAQKNESGTYDFGAIVMNDEPLVFGAEDQYGRVPYPGKIDEVKIWNYPLDEIYIANLYLEYRPDENVCIEEDAAWRYFDVAGEPGGPSYCIIDIEDFAEVAAAWMMCNLVPECLP